MLHNSFPLSRVWNLMTWGSVVFDSTLRVQQCLCCDVPFPLLCYSYEVGFSVGHSLLWADLSLSCSDQASWNHCRVHCGWQAYHHAWSGLDVDLELPGNSDYFKNDYATGMVKLENLLFMNVSFISSSTAYNCSFHHLFLNKSARAVKELQKFL